jgi:nitrite reductase (NADH) large subunit
MTPCKHLTQVFMPWVSVSNTVVKLLVWLNHCGASFYLRDPFGRTRQLNFKAPTVPTQLKVSGVDVFSAGNFEPKDDYEDIILNDEKRQIYKRIIIQNDRVIGAVLFGDTEDGMWYAELIADQTPVSSFRNKLLFGRDFALKNAG